MWYWVSWMIGLVSGVVWFLHMDREELMILREENWQLMEENRQLKGEIKEVNYFKKDGQDVG